MFGNYIENTNQLMFLDSLESTTFGTHIAI